MKTQYDIKWQNSEKNEFKLGKGKNYKCKIVDGVEVGKNCQVFSVFVGDFKVCILLPIIPKCVEYCSEIQLFLECIKQHWVSPWWLDSLHKPIIVNPLSTQRLICPLKVLNVFVISWRFFALIWHLQKCVT